MLDTTRIVAIDGLPGVRVYPDDESKTAFYALPERPRVAVDEQGRPELSLIAYGRQGPAGFVVKGGMVTLTTALQLAADETTQVVAALTRRLAAEFPQPDDAPPLVPELRPIDWTAGTVTVTLVPGVTLEGGPALYGANRCAFSLNVDARQIEAVLEAWRRGLPDASIGYRLTPRIGGGASFTRRESRFESWSIGAPEPGLNAASYENNAERRTVQGPPPELAFTGPIIPEGVDPEQFLTITTL